MLDTIGEECGIAAVYSKKKDEKSKKEVLFYLYKLMLNLQNRGQLSAGVTTYNEDRDQLLDTYKNLGHVNEVFETARKEKSAALFKRYLGNKGIGHVRYATCGSDIVDVAQPFERHHGRKWKWFSFALNGNLSNYVPLKKQLMEKTDYHITYDTDTEIIMHYLSQELKSPKKKPDLVKVFANIAKKFDGAYNLVFINGEGEMVIFRDPQGFRPLVYGWKDDNVFMAASESNALINCGVRKFKDLPPGHLIHIKDGKVKVIKYTDSKKTSHCMFEYVYFANVSSVLDNRSVYLARSKLGKEMAKIETQPIDDDCIVVPVPDTAKASGDAYAFELGIPAREGVIRNRYVGRTFIEGGSRYEIIQSKYTVLREVMDGKRVFLVDDSIVRGSTTKQLIRYIREEGGAKEVHIRITCPPIRGPCFYGIDMSTVSELLVPGYEKKPLSGDVDQKICDKIAKDLGADSLQYQTIGGLIRAIKKPADQLCLACINGKYPTPVGKKLYVKAWENHKSGKKGARTYA